jgi:uncharacterized protein (TIGR04141 family)
LSKKDRPAPPERTKEQSKQYEGMSEQAREGASLLLPLNSFLLRAELRPSRLFSESVESEETWWSWQRDHLESLEDSDELLQAAGPGDVVVVLVDRPTAAPAWQTLVRDALQVPGFGAAGRSIGAVIFCAVLDPEDEALRWVAFSFGSASKAVRKRAVEPRFGLLTALNRISMSQMDPTDNRGGLLRQASYRALGPYSYQAGYRAARDTPLDSFRIDRVADLLSAAGGRTGPVDDPDQVFGSRSLRTRQTVSSVASLSAIAAEAITDYRRIDYRNDFAFVDQIVPVYDDGTETELRSALLNALLSGSDSVDVLLPDDLVPFEDERAISFIVRPGQSRAAASDTVLTPEMVASMVDVSDHGSLDRLLRFCDASHNEIARAPILDCLAAELEIDGRRYVTYDGDFFQVDSSLLERIDDAIDSVPIWTEVLPCYGGGAEATWNGALGAHDPRFLSLDGRFIRLPGETAFEPCDVLDAQGTLIHAKRKSRSSTMSHLFVQAERSCELLTQEPEARHQLATQVRTACGETGADPASALRVVQSLASRTHGLSLVLALLGDWHNRDLHNLPLLARISLISSVGAIRRHGFAPSVALVPLCSRPVD